MTYQVAGVDYRVSLGAFFQVNRGLVGTLVELATHRRSGLLAWDLYAGVGLFSRVLASRFEQVVAVEAAPTAYQDLRANLGLPHQAICSGTLEFLRREAARPHAGKSRGSKPVFTPPRSVLPDFVLVDPPRAGLGEEAARLLSQIGPGEITYVSCDPATLSRDLRVLVNSGYKLNEIHLIDLFPQTFHLETVAMLSRP
jgi:23S rRNA (uracil1939-C5)-methyltransferase